ncbi:MAG: hypothetical protein ACRD2W_14705 [Acidimicrobiales bacterium]
MYFANSYEVPSNEHLYRKVKSEIGDEQPDGLVVHLVVKSDGGLRHIGVWETQAAWERFRDERVRPAVGRVLEAAGIAPPPPPPAEEQLDLIDVATGR